jgi:hypothetical protein
MPLLTSITRLPPSLPIVNKGESVDALTHALLAPISTALPTVTTQPDRMLMLSRKLARQSRDEAAAMDPSSADFPGA